MNFTFNCFKPLAIAVLFVCILGCNKKNTTALDIDFLIPEQAVLVIKSNNFKSLTEQFRANKSLQKLLENESTKDFESSLAFTKHLNTDQALVLASSKLGKADYAQVIITEASNDSISNLSLESISYEGEVIKKYSATNTEFYQIRLNAYDYWSNDLLILEDLIRLYQSDDITYDESFQRILSSAKSNDQNLFIKMPTSNPFGGLIPEVVRKSALFKNEGWLHLSVDLELNTATCQGVFMPKSTISTTDKNTLASQNLNFPHFNVLNFESIEVISLSGKPFEDPLLMAQNEQNPELLSGFSKAIRADKAKALLLECIDPELCKTSLNTEQQTPEHIYRGVSILKNDGTAQNISKGFGNPFSYYFFLNQYLIYTKDLDVAENIVLNLQDVISEENSNNIFTAEAPTQSHKARFVKYGESMPKTILAEFVLKEKNFYHYYLALAPEQKSTINQAQYTTISVSHSSEFITEPQFFSNWRTKAQEVLIQDKLFRLYKYNLSGEVIWSKQLDAAIMGPIYEVDMYKNGRIQMLFNTANQVYILDKDGNEVAPFPLKFKDKLTQPIALFDYDNNKNYRLLITQDRQLQMLDINGKTVKGFKFKKTKSAIAQPPKHIRIGTKDYILIQEENGKLHITDRTGKTRVPQDGTFTDLLTPWSAFENAFAAIDKRGKLWKISTSGSIISEETLAKNPENALITKNKVFLIEDNKIYDKLSAFDLDYGKYSRLAFAKSNTDEYLFTTNMDDRSLTVLKNLQPVESLKVYALGNPAILKQKNGFIVAVAEDSKRFLIYRLKL